MRTDAASAFKDLLGLSHGELSREEEESLAASVEIAGYQEGEVVVHEESVERNCLFYVLSGCVSVSQRSTDADQQVRDSPDCVEMHKAYPGGFLGQLQVLTSEPSFFTYKLVDFFGCVQ